MTRSTLAPESADFTEVEIASPIGALRATVRGEVLCAVDFAGRRAAGGGRSRSPIVARFEAYFAGKLDALDEIRIDPTGPAFQRKVWRVLRRIPAGETRSYSELAEAVGSPRAVRAVGLANARNPIVLVLPCHRVIGKSGDLTGYGGGLWRKRWLLEHEGAATRRR